ncbi:MAG TPA: septum site-determining protein MinC [Desulfotomaculum sp.]|nr:septum site-determining protein MinC [Desulfotomaculum sp.]
MSQLMNVPNLCKSLTLDVGIVPKEAVNIKGTRQGLVILFDAEQRFEDLKAGLKYKMESSRGFFTGARFILYGANKLVPAEINELESICAEYGLIADPDVQWPPGRPQKSRKVEPASLKRPLPGDPALLVKRTLRSGQLITHPGHITVLGDVHAGAEVVAGGNVLIMGTCSGFIQAGAGGDASTCIVALSIFGAQLRIADKTLIVTNERPPGSPLIARIKQNQVVISEYEL